MGAGEGFRMTKNKFSGKEHPLNLFFVDSMENVRTYFRTSAK
jgi:hypothetical protein